MANFNLKNIAYLLAVASLGASVAIETPKSDVEATAWKMTAFCE
jgi:hypothetical protein